MEMMSPTSSTTISVPFLSAAARAAIAARRGASGASAVKRAPRSSSRASVEPVCSDGTNNGRGNHPVDWPPGGQPIPQIGGRDVETRDGHPLDLPAASGGFGVRIGESLDDDDRGEVARLVET